MLAKALSTLASLLLLLLRALVYVCEGYACGSL